MHPNGGGGRDWSLSLDVTPGLICCGLFAIVVFYVIVYFVLTRLRRPGVVRSLLDVPVLGRVVFTILLFPIVWALPKRSTTCPECDGKGRRLYNTPAHFVSRIRTENEFGQFDLAGIIEREYGHWEPAKHGYYDCEKCGGTGSILEKFVLFLETSDVEPYKEPHGLNRYRTWWTMCGAGIGATIATTVVCAVFGIDPTPESQAFLGTYSLGTLVLAAVIVKRLCDASLWHVLWVWPVVFAGVALAGPLLIAGFFRGVAEL